MREIFAVKKILLKFDRSEAETKKHHSYVYVTIEMSIHVIERV